MSERPLGALHVAAVVIGATVGVGIFFTPAATARVLPSPGWLLAIWALGGIAALSGAFVFSTLGARHPHAGGVYVFLREGFGPRSAFLYGWLQLLVIQPGAMAVIALVLIDHVVVLTHPVSPFFRSVLAIVTIAGFALANLLGMKTGGRIQIAMSAMKAVILALVTISALVWGSASLATAHPTRPVGGGVLTWIVLGLIPVLFTYGGSYHGTFIAGSVENAKVAVPRGIFGGVAVVIVGYLGVNIAYLAMLGHDALAASDSPAAQAAGIALGPGAGKVVAAIIVVSAAGILNTVCLGFPFVVYAMAQDGLFFARAGRLDPKTGRPAFAIALQGALACIAVIVGGARVDVLLTGIAFADAAFQAAAAVLAFRARPITAATFFLIEAGVAAGCLWRTPRESSLGAFALILGVLVYALWRRPLD